MKEKFFLVVMFALFIAVPVFAQEQEAGSVTVPEEKETVEETVEKRIDRLENNQDRILSILEQQRNTQEEVLRQLGSLREQIAAKDEGEKEAPPAPTSEGEGEGEEETPPVPAEDEGEKEAPPAPTSEGNSEEETSPVPAEGGDGVGAGEVEPEGRTGEPVPETALPDDRETEVTVETEPLEETTEYYIFETGVDLDRNDQIEMCVGNLDEIYFPDSATRRYRPSVDSPSLVEIVRTNLGGANFIVKPINRIEGEVGITREGIEFLLKELADEMFDDVEGLFFVSELVTGRQRQWTRCEAKLVKVNKDDGEEVVEEEESGEEEE